jgi:hypothetical protein
LSNDQRKSLLQQSHVMPDEYTKPAPRPCSYSLSFFKHRDPLRPSCYCKMIRVDSRGLHSWSSDYLRSNLRMPLWPAGRVGCESSLMRWGVTWQSISFYACIGLYYVIMQRVDTFLSCSRNSDLYGSGLAATTNLLNP